jgi:hypothetical protein
MNVMGIFRSVRCGLSALPLISLGQGISHPCPPPKRFLRPVSAEGLHQFTAIDIEEC